MKETKPTRQTDEIAAAHPSVLNAESEFTMIVFSHLRWNFVYQRPQHILTGLSKMHKILFVEEPVHIPDNENVPAGIFKVSDRITVLQPNTTYTGNLGELLISYLGTNNAQIGWFYSAAFVPVLDHLHFSNVVYDCMDELSLFKGANPLLVEQEKKLLQNAGIVFTGGKSLYEAKKKMHSNVHCFPSSVDTNHFEKALQPIPVPVDMERFSGPVAGYYGVIDERIDLELIRETAQLNPDINFVFIGPLAKISDDDLPRAKNIFYLGMKSYESLPNYLKRFDVAIMPFALNDATKFISPTKTLEFMAAGKPIISTGITDVVRDYSSYIHIVKDAMEFSTALKEIVIHEIKNCDYTVPLNKTSWEATVQQMQELLNSKQNDK
jgi:glycosyltransferase involved in cell wall biosynthesis